MLAELVRVVALVMTPDRIERGNAIYLGNDLIGTNAPFLEREQHEKVLASTVLRRCVVCGGSSCLRSDWVQ